MQERRGNSRRAPSPGTNHSDDNITIQAPANTTTETATHEQSSSVPASAMEMTRTRRAAAMNRGTNRPWGRKGKAPRTDSPRVNKKEDAMVSDAKNDGREELVDEGAFSTDEEDEDLDDEDNARSVITVSSSPEQPERMPFGMIQRPWLVEGFSDRLRHTWEVMYAQIQQTPLANSWDATEAYQKEKDDEMLLYIQDFPLSKWVIPTDQAEAAYSQLVDRLRWRSLGIPIYSQSYTNGMVGHPPNVMLPPPLGMPPDHQRGPLPQNPSSYRPPPQSHYSPQQRPPPGQQIQHGPLPPHLPPPHPSQMLPSQPHAQPLPPPSSRQLQHPPKMGPPGPPNHPQSHPTGPPPQGYPMSPFAMNHHGPLPPEMIHAQGVYHQMNPYGHAVIQPGTTPPGSKPSTHRRMKDKKDKSPPGTPPPPPPTPPYKPREKPAERKVYNKTGKRNVRKQAEADEYPWHRKIDFKEAREKAYWDDSMYDKHVLDEMAATRRKNEPFIMKLDEEQSEKQRQARIKKKARLAGTMECETSDGERKKPGQKGRLGSGGDPYHSGTYTFATEEDARKGAALGSGCQIRTPDEIIEAAEAGRIEWALCKEIKICWNPGKKGTTESLTQATFRVYDTLVTRKQLSNTKVLTKRAAECIIDFCPDLLWRETLLRIASEGGMGNKDVRDRFCFNGCYADKATITKRLAAALGQKQTQPNKVKDAGTAAAAVVKEDEDLSAAPDPVGTGSANKKRRGPTAQPKSERWHPGEEDYYTGNGTDFDNYIRFFGLRQSTRNQPKLAVAAGTKRRGTDDEGEGADVKRARTEEGMSSDVDIDTAEEDEDEGDEGVDVGGGGDVSAQDSDILDEIED